MQQPAVLSAACGDGDIDLAIRATRSREMERDGE